MLTDPHSTAVTAALAPALAAFACLAMLAPGATARPVDELLRLDDVRTQTGWARRYEHAEGVPRNHGAAVRLYCAAARAGYAPAQYALGWMYANGRGVSRDDALAAAWLRRAAAAGDQHAARVLARIVGDEVPAEDEARCVLPGGAEELPALGTTARPSRALIERWVRHLSPGYDLDPALVLAVIETESAFDPRALSPKQAMGLMQLIPATASRFGVRDAYDPEENLRGGMAYLRWLLEHFEGDVRLALAGYNAGEHAVARHRGIPPYAETRAYVRRVMARVEPHRLPSPARPPARARAREPLASYRAPRAVPPRSRQRAKGPGPATS